MKKVHVYRNFDGSMVVSRSRLLVSVCGLCVSMGSLDCSIFSSSSIPSIPN